MHTPYTLLTHTIIRCRLAQSKQVGHKLRDPLGVRLPVVAPCLKKDFATLERS